MQFEAKNKEIAKSIIGKYCTPKPLIIDAIVEEMFSAFRVARLIDEDLLQQQAQDEIPYLTDQEKNEFIDSIDNINNQLRNTIHKIEDLEKEVDELEQVKPAPKKRGRKPKKK